jgi:Lrp/AsnC family transcriptional regulator, leucine-responsive regulatory protein
MDETDLTILGLLQENARLPAAEIARSVGLGASAVHQRIRKLEESGVIQGYEARLDPRALGRDLVSFVRVQTGEGARAEEITAGLVALPEVQEVHRVVGEDCFFVKVRVKDTRALAHLLDDRIQRIPNVAATKTTIVLTTAKESRAIPLDESPSPMDSGSPAASRTPLPERRAVNAG